MTSITISRQLGSLGEEVAQAIAEQLNYRVVYRELINQAAVRARQPELALAMIDDLGLFNLHPSPSKRKAFHQALQEVMEELANEGSAVLIGRAGQVILGNRPDVLHIKVFAPAQVRAERVASLQKISPEAAKAQIEASDRARSGYLRRFYHARWDDPGLYDIIINTARLAPEQAACMVSHAVTICQTIDD
jgi:cytidylate kinase